MKYSSVYFMSHDLIELKKNKIQIDLTLKKKISKIIQERYQILLDQRP